MNDSTSAIPLNPRWGDCRLEWSSPDWSQTQPDIKTSTHRFLCSSLEWRVVLCSEPQRTIMISARSPYDISAKSPGATRTKGDKPLWELALGQVLQTLQCETSSTKIKPFPTLLTEALKSRLHSIVDCDHTGSLTCSFIWLMIMVSSVLPYFATEQLETAMRTDLFSL